MVIPQKIKHGVAILPNNPASGHIDKRTKADIHTPMSSAASFTTARRWTQPVCAQWLNGQTWCGPSGSASKQKKTLSPVTTQTNLEDVTLRETSPIQDNKHCGILLIRGSPIHGAEGRRVVAKSEGSGGKRELPLRGHSAGEGAEVLEAGGGAGCTTV